MFDLLEKYKQKGHFILGANDSLAQVCNAPPDASGVYLVYALAGGSIELVYIGRSGKLAPDKTIKHRIGGIRGRFLSGKQFGDRRVITWPARMKAEKIEALDVYWYITHSLGWSDCPDKVERQLLDSYFELYGELPRWNKK